MKKQSNLSILMDYAGGYRILTYLSWILSVMSALISLVPFWYIWRIIRDVLKAAPDFSQAENVTRYGWSAVLFAVMAIVVYIAALMCSHISCISGGCQYAKKDHATYYNFASGHNGEIWKRKLKKNCKYL